MKSQRVFDAYDEPIGAVFTLAPGERLTDASRNRAIAFCTRYGLSGHIVTSVRDGSIVVEKVQPRAVERLYLGRKKRNG